MMRSPNLTGVPSFPQPSNSTLLTSLSSQNLCAHVFPKHSGVRWRSPPAEDLATNNALKLDKILLPQRRRAGKTTKSPIFHSTNFPPATQPPPTTTAARETPKWPWPVGQLCLNTDRPPAAVRTVLESL